MAEDWQLMFAEPYRGRAFVLKPYRRGSETWDHDHCLICSRRLAEPTEPWTDADHEGYASTEEDPHGADYNWVCVSCFTDLQHAVGWRDLTPPGP